MEEEDGDIRRGLERNGLQVEKPKVVLHRVCELCNDAWADPHEARLSETTVVLLLLLLLPLWPAAGFQIPNMKQETRNKSKDRNAA